MRKLIPATILAALAALALTASAPIRAFAQNVPCYFQQGGAVFHLDTGCDVQVNGVSKIGNIINGPQVFSGGAVAAGKKIAFGAQTTVTATDTVVTGLSTVVACIANLDAGPTADPEVATCSVGNQAGAPAAGSIYIQTWKTLGSTPVASATFSKVVTWTAWGS